MAKARPQLDKLANGKKKPMSRTSGVAGRRLGRSEGIATKLKYGAPLTGSASGVKSISLKDAGEVLTSGIVTLGKKGLQADPASLAMALPVGKVLKAAQALKAVGKVKQSAALFARVGAKIRGKEIGRTSSYFDEPVDVARARRVQSESVFPRLPDNSIPGTARTFDTYADPLLEGAGRFGRGTKRGNKLVKAIEKNEVQSGMYIGSKEAIKRAAFNSTRPVAKLPKGRGK